MNESTKFMNELTDDEVMNNMNNNFKRFENGDNNEFDKVNSVKIDKTTFPKPIPKFYHNSKVEIIIGFYRGYTGIVKEFTYTKNNTINYKIEISELDNNAYIIAENEIRFKKKFLGIF